MKSIYGVADQTGHTVYVGSTKLRVARRLKLAWSHRYQAQTPFQMWLRTLEEIPEYFLIASVEDGLADVVEREYIQTLKMMYPHRLLNVATFGRGNRGRFEYSDAERKKHALAATGVKFTAERRLKISLARKAAWNRALSNHT